MRRKKNRIKFKSTYNRKRVNYMWICTITVATFLIAFSLECFSKNFLSESSIFSTIIILFSIVFIGIFFDLLGISVTAARERPLHAMGSKKIRGAKESIGLIRNAGAVSNFFNDAIGDVSGIISGTAIMTIILRMDRENPLIDTLLIAAIAALTVGGKAIGKEIALRKSNHMVFLLGYFLSFFTNTFSFQKKKS